MSINDLNDITSDLSTEDVPSLADFAEEVGGAWAKGWYAAEVIEGYSTRKGKVFATEDVLSNKGDSRNMRLCLRVSDGKNERTMHESFNYRTSDFSQARLEYIKEMRTEHKGVKGAWADKDAQRTSLAVASLGQLEKALGFRLKRNGQGELMPGVFVGQKLDVYLNVDDNGYNEVTQFAPFTSRTSKKSSTSA